MPEFHYEPLFQLGVDETEYRRLDIEGLVAKTAVGEREILSIESVKRTLDDHIPERRKHIIAPNKHALDRGVQYVRG